MATAYENTYASLAKARVDEIVKAPDPCPVRAIRILTSLRRESNIPGQPITVSILNNTKIGKVTAKTVNLCKRLRTAKDNGKWHEVSTIAEALLVNFRAVFDTEGTTAKDNNEQMAMGRNSRSERPKRKLQYATRFDSQSFDSNAKERKVTNNSRGTAHGFYCPRCATLCSYDSKGCTICSLECYYKVGVGVLGLKGRDRDMSGSLKRKRSRIQEDKEVDCKLKSAEREIARRGKEIAKRDKEIAALKEGQSALLNTIESLKNSIRAPFEQIKTILDTVDLTVGETEPLNERPLTENAAKSKLAILSEGNQKVAEVKREKNAIEATLGSVREDKEAAEADLSAARDDLEYSDERLSDQMLATNILRGRIDEICSLVQSGQADMATVSEIRNRCLSRGH